MIAYSLIGLGMIIAGWLVQFFMMNKSKKVYPGFVMIYALGVLVLVYDGFVSGMNNLAIANLISLLVAILVLVKVMKK